MNNDLAITALIRSLESQRYLAMQRGDLETFYRLAHPELIYVHSNGVKDDLASYLNKCRNRVLGHPVSALQCPTAHAPLEPTGCAGS